MKTDELREKYLTFFASKGCKRCESDVLVPTWDPSVLFTPAGMNPFKDHFLGRVKLDFTRATSCQKCLRTGDIDNVGRTAYHHTFFEMLGNFSFGDYFKREAIHWAWEFLTKKEWLGLDPDRLSVTVYLDDDEAADIWHDEIKLPTSRIVRMGEDDNFWPAGAPTQGPDGVCGPCSEIFYHPDKGGEVEIWNLVFTQFNRVGDPPDNLRPLPSKNIDTGMGLERTAATLQGVTTNYHIDILKPIVMAAAEVCGQKYEPDSDEGRRLRRITDHVRACAFAVHENVYPGPNKEKYVIRRLLRRAVLDGHQMGMREPFLHKLVPVVVEMMKSAYPDLTETTSRVSKVIEQEESAFLGTIDQGLNKIGGIFHDMQSDGRSVVRGEDIFYMFDTHGFPPELFAQLAAEHNCTLDWQGYQEIIKGRESGPTGRLFGEKGPIEALKEAGHTTKFLGYEKLEAPAKILGIIAQDHLCDELDEVGHEDLVTVVLDESPFYGESGGQVGDKGEIEGKGFRFEVVDTQRDGQLILHLGHLRSGTMSDGASCTAHVDVTRRQAIRRAHSATHILHYALRKHLGEHAQQQGSKVDADWLRFDFTNLEPVGGEQLDEVGSEISHQITSGAPVKWTTLPLAEARKQGAMMLFGEKYPDPVRMVSMGEFSRELCGGTHLDNTAEVEAFEILSEESVSAGVRRIVAITGPRAKAYEDELRRTLTSACKTLGVGPTQVEDRVSALTRLVKDLKKGKKSELPTVKAASETDITKLPWRDIRHTVAAIARQLNVAPGEVGPRLTSLLAECERLQQELAAAPDAEELSADQLLATAELVGDVKVVVGSAAGANPNVLRQLIDQIRQKAGPVAVMLGSKLGDDKAVLVAGLSKELVDRGFSAGDWVRTTSKLVDGSGGGKPDMAQAGGKSPDKIGEALQAAKAELASSLQAK